MYESVRVYERGCAQQRPQSTIWKHRANGGGSIGRGPTGEVGGCVCVSVLFSVFSPPGLLAYWALGLLSLFGEDDGFSRM